MEKLHGAPESGEQGGTQGHGQRDVDGRGSVTQSCVAALDGGRVTNAQEGPSNIEPSLIHPTRLLEQASTGLEGEDVGGIESWE